MKFVEKTHHFHVRGDPKGPPGLFAVNIGDEQLARLILGMDP